MPIVNVNNIHLNYEMEGDGEPLVIVPGMCSSLQDWSRHMPYFRKHFKVICVDNRGVGLSDKPEGDYSISMMAKDVIALLDHLGIEQANFLGTSMGGAIVQKIGLQYPDRTLKLVIANSTAKFSPFSGQVINAQIEALEKTNDFGLFYRIGMPWIFSPNFFKDQALVAEILSIITYAGDKITIAGVKGQAAACAAHDTTARLSEIKAPVLVIAASEDILIRPAESEAMANLIPNAKYVLIYGPGHACPTEGFDEFVRIVNDFLLNHHMPE